MPKETPTVPKNPSNDEVWRGVDSLPVVRERLASGVPLARIARKFGVSRQAIYDAMKKETPTPTGEGSDDPKEGLAIAIESVAQPSDSGSKPGQ